MKDDKATKKRLLDSARKEFMEKGYAGASLRKICKDAGVTTGALYFFFKDKEDLFASIVEEPLNKLYDIMFKHYENEIKMLTEGTLNSDDNKDDINVAYGAVHFMYKYYDEFQLVLCKSQGSKFENTIDRFVEISEGHYKIFAKYYSKQKNVPEIDDYMLHWISHMQIDAFIHIITHYTSEEDAMNYIRYVIKFLIGGWFAMYMP